MAEGGGLFRQGGAPALVLHRGEEAPAASRRPRNIAVGRDLTDFHRIDLSRVDPSERKRFARMEGIRLSAFPAPAVYAHIDGDAALVWTWDEARAVALLEESGAAESDPAALAPETGLYPPSMEGEEARLVLCAHGVEGQVWRSGALVASRWWAEPPAPDHWAIFVRSAGATPGPPPEPARLPFLGRPWTRNAAAESGLASLSARAPRYAAAAAALLLAFSIGVLARAEWRAASAGREWAEAVTRARPVTQELNRMEAAAERALALQAAVAGVDAAEVMTAVQTVMAGRAEELVAMTYADGRMELTLAQASMLQSADLVRVFEDHPQFSEVNVERGRDATELVVQMNAAQAPAPL